MMEVVGIVHKGNAVKEKAAEMIAFPHCGEGE